MERKRKRQRWNLFAVAQATVVEMTQKVFGGTRGQDREKIIESKDLYFAGLGKLLYL